MRKAMSIAVRTTQEDVFVNTGMSGSDARFGRIAKGGHLKRRDIKNNVKYVARILSRFRHL